ncbi:MAG TPA: (Fe-S)-binding protein, partial [Myxococcota bacterium]|nr:(Fe-S)-binding protein [Myxococcota bacterium]
AFEVIHHTSLLAALVAEGRLSFEGGKSDAVVYHDSCYLGRYNGIYEDPRKALAGAGLSLVEADRSGKTAMCCGAGGGMMFRDEKEGSRINRLRVNQLVETGAKSIVSACPFCLVMCRDGINEEGIDQNVSAFDVSEVLAERLKA